MHKTEITTNHLNTAKPHTAEDPTCEEDPNGFQLTALYEHTGGLVQWSPNGNFLAVANGNRLAIRHAKSFRISQLFSALDVIQVVWSYALFV